MLRSMLADTAHKLPAMKGKHRVFRCLISALSQRGSFNVRRAGVNYEVNGVDLIDYYIMSNDFESPDITEILTKVIGQKPLMFWDIGANVGGVTLPVLRSCPFAKAVAIEPSPSVAGRLLRNIQSNSDLQARCQVVGAALSDVSGLTEFFISGSSGNSGVGGLAKAPNRNGFGHLVNTHRADEIADRVGVPDVVKIDVEGFELEVLRGFGELLNRDLLILFEHNLYRFEERQRPLDEVTQFLTACGFTLTTLDGGPIDLLQDGDFVAMKGAFLNYLAA